MKTTLRAAVLAPGHSQYSWKRWLLRKWGMETEWLVLHKMTADPNAIVVSIHGRGGQWVAGRVGVCGGGDKLVCHVGRCRPWGLRGGQVGSLDHSIMYSLTVCRVWGQGGGGWVWPRHGAAQTRSPALSLPSFPPYCPPNPKSPAGEVGEGRKADNEENNWLQ